MARFRDSISHWKDVLGSSKTHTGNEKSDEKSTTTAKADSGHSSLSNPPPTSAPLSTMPSGPDTLQFPAASSEQLAPYLPTKSSSSKTTPFTTLTFATSLDASLALQPGTQTHLSGPESKAMTHYLRSQHAAILIGAGTARADDPGLNCRLEGVGLDSQPRPIVVGNWEFAFDDLDDEDEGNGEDDSILDGHTEDGLTEDGDADGESVDSAALDEHVEAFTSVLKERGWVGAKPGGVGEGIKSQVEAAPPLRNDSVSHAQLLKKEKEKQKEKIDSGDLEEDEGSFPELTQIISSKGWDRVSRCLRAVKEGKGKAPWILVPASQIPPATDRRRKYLEKMGGRYIGISDSNSNTDSSAAPGSGAASLDWTQILTTLKSEGIDSVMVEGGGTVINSLMAPGYEDLIDSVVVTIAPVWLGQGGVVVSPARKAGSKAALRLKSPKWCLFGEDAVVCGRV
ncbi:hypothetical protein K402DRAFT_388640 [Aulographum hederae CBS 113979]|uniref:2,5-diamino-6-ribosylamino-4(3H)-pyrimidinone 5'-phosphate reductase n=1 Tax=Aulographum hederae CBS 113979 TaxID=1176131 RepID=A0A6G1HG59_9PEZI|nr:hypothetical protein K402DRAFT_388640 [Aulographum hederae CBS 113979]